MPNDARLLIYFEPTPLNILVERSLRHPSLEGARITRQLEDATEDPPLALESFDVILAVGAGATVRRRLDQLKARGAAAPILLLTEELDEADIAEAFHAGAFNCISRKRIDRLVPAVLRALDSSSARTESLAPAAVHAEDGLTHLPLDLPAVVLELCLSRDGTLSVPRANEKLAEYFGLAPAEVSDDATPLFERLHPDDAAELRAEIERSALEGTPIQETFRVVRGQRPERWFTINANPHPARDENVHWSAFITSISANMETEARLRAALKEVSSLKHVLDQHVIVATTDRRGRITSANDKFCQLSGYSREELIGEDHRILNSGAHPPEFFRRLWATIGRGQTWRGEIRNRAKDGAFYWVDTVIIPQLGSDGRPFEYVAIRTDITRLKELERNLERARDQAMEASRLKSEFLANMSHEIRTPMNGIIGMSGLLLDMPVDAESRHMAGIIQSSAESLLTIINDILDFSRIEAGKMRLDFAEFDLEHLVHDTIELLEASAQSKHLTLVCNYPARPRELLYGDPGRIRQVLTNLIGNAIKFTESGAVVVSVSFRPQASQRVALRVAVRDTGPGIPLEEQKRLFQPFVQVDGSITRKHGGTGLGLAISRQLIELMNGHLGLESEPDHGSTFWFELELSCRTVGENPTTTTPSGARRVLLVDDRAENREVLTRQLLQCGLEVEAVPDAQSALSALSSASSPQEWNLVVLDHKMPEQSGIELARSIRSDPALAEIPLVMLSSVGTPVEIDEAMELGFTAILTKPVRSDQIHRVVLSALRDKEAERPREAAPPVPPLRILLVEDNLSNQAVADSILTRMGHHVSAEINGADALARLAKEAFDLILMDCQMPVLDGYETTRRIRAGAVEGLDPDIPIVALTAHALPQDRIKCLDAGMDHYLTKPIRPTKLQAVLAQCAAGRESPEPGEPPPPDPTHPSWLLDPETVECLRDHVGKSGGTLFEELAHGFLKGAPEEFLTLRAAALDEDHSEVRHCAHRLGNLAASVGALGLHQQCSQIERAASLPGPSPLQDLDFEAAQDLLDRVCGHLQTLVEHPQRSS